MHTHKSCRVISTPTLVEKVIFFLDPFVHATVLSFLMFFALRWQLRKFKTKFLMPDYVMPAIAVPLGFHFQFSLLIWICTTPAGLNLRFPALVLLGAFPSLAGEPCMENQL
jgi:hypothetical protein